MMLLPFLRVERIHTDFLSAHLRYSFSLFLPTIISSLGFTNDKTAQLMTVPPYIAACVCCIGGGYLADRHGQRGIYMIFFNCVAIFGFILQIASSNNALKYAGTFFAAMGIYPNVPQGVAWNGNNIGGSTKRGVGIGKLPWNTNLMQYLVSIVTLYANLILFFVPLCSHARRLRQSRRHHRRLPLPRQG